MTFSIRHLNWSLLTICAVVIATEALGQGPYSTSKTITWTSVSNSSDMQIGILGEIARPGAYRVDSGSLSVQSIVRKAGGLTDEASLSIRIVRQGQVVQILYFSPTADTRLWPNDLLVVESRRVMSAVSKVLNPNLQANPIQPVAVNSGEPQGIQVAFLNVLDSPVIVKLRPEDADIERVVLMLGQPIELAGAVKLLGPERYSAAQTLSTAGSSTTATATKLTDGTVVVFPKGSIHRNKLPALPKPIDSEIAAGAIPSAIGGPSGQSTELRNVGQLAPLIALPGAASEKGSQTTVTPIAPAPPQPSTINTEVPRSFTETDPVPTASTPRIATVPFTGTPRQTTSSSQKKLEAEAAAPLPRDGQQTALAKPSSPLPRDRFENDLNQTATSTSTKPFSLSQMLGFFVTVAGLIGLALVARKHFERQQGKIPSAIPRPERSPAQTVPIVPTTETPSASSPEITATEPASLLKPLSPGQNLERLIQNNLKLREELVRFPELVVLQGQVAPRVIHRVDAASAATLGAGHHFRKPESDTVATLGDVDVTVRHTHPASDVLSSGPHFKQQVEETDSVEVVNHSPASTKTARTSPLAKALRQLEGGLST